MANPPNNSNPQIYWGASQPPVQNVGYYQIPPPNFPPPNLSQPPPMFNVPPPPAPETKPTDVQHQQQFNAAAAQPYSASGAFPHHQPSFPIQNSQSPSYPSSIVQGGYNCGWNWGQANATPSWDGNQSNFSAGWNEAPQAEKKGDFRAYTTQKSTGERNSWKGNDPRGHTAQRSASRSINSGRSSERKRSRSSESRPGRSGVGGYERSRREQGRGKHEGFGRERSNAKEDPSDGDQRSSRRRNELHSRSSSRASIDEERVNLASRSRKRSRSRESVASVATGSAAAAARQKSLSERDQLLEKYRYIEGNA